MAMIGSGAPMLRRAPSRISRNEKLPTSNSAKSGLPARMPMLLNSRKTKTEIMQDMSAKKTSK